MKTKITKTFRFDESLIKKAEVLASKDKRCLNNWLEVLIEKEVSIKLPDKTSNIEKPY